MNTPHSSEFNAILMLVHNLKFFFSATQRQGNVKAAERFLSLTVGHRRSNIGS